MSSGNDTQDFRHYVSTSAGVVLVGSYYERNWNGTNAPVVSYPPVLHDPSQGTYAGMPRRPPKRARSMGEHPYHMTLNSKFTSVVAWHSPPESPQYTGPSDGFGGASLTFKWSDNDSITLINKLREKIIGSDFNPAVTMAEGGESLKTITSAATAIAKAYHQAKRGNFAAASKALRKHKKGESVAHNVASNWLELQYGIKPLLQDVYNAAITLAHMSSVPIQQTYTVTHRVAGEIESASPTVVRFDGYCYSVGKLKAVLREVNIPKLLGVTDPATVLWEKTPYSFVADWFVPIGDYLEARGVANSVSGTFTTSRMDKGYAEGPIVVDPQLIIGGSGASVYYLKNVIVDRTVTDSLSVPTPSIKPLKTWATWNHAANAVSLLVSRFRK